MQRRALVVTVVHHPEDARIRHREIAALLEAGWQVTYAAPFTGYGLPLPEVASLEPVNLPRAQGRRRIGALRAARRLLRERGAAHHVVLLHDPELLLAARTSGLANVVWDVHEDTAAALTMKPWLPGWIARPAAWAVRRLELGAENRHHLILAEHDYQHRFRKDHLVVPNTTRVPATLPAGGGRHVVYVGHNSRARGVQDLIDLGAALAGDGIAVRVIGHADAEAAAALEAASNSGTNALTWLGFRTHGEAMAELDGALAGLSLLHDEPNYRHSQPTKVIEYMAHGVPVVTTPLPKAVEVVEAADAGIVVPFGDTMASAEAIRSLANSPDKRDRLGANGHAYTRDHHDWTTKSVEFVDHLASL
ncbi:glycosyltransferase family 4 protein [Nocardioides sp. AE5]|uniref:glycosyltransferase family 4 protein n=1 Tax=Nocardioides sp. AE5 TaxID=2962573 RepID=UPI002880E20B|nr:glycosyltransferase family 4 protein [Nocardioides sp. AE5]MDT0203797.1 glycosyltransferase family 4 protein [Nocardioides sp. AE5]